MRYFKLSVVVLFAALLLPLNLKADEKLDQSAEAFRETERRMDESARWFEETQRRREQEEADRLRDNKLQELEDRLDAQEPFK